MKQIPETALAAHSAFVGTTGSGKTYAAKGAVERLLEQRKRVCIIDPTGVWWGLRSSADGQRDGFPVIVFGGVHADVAIAETSGPALARLIAERNLPAVIDLSEMLIGERHRFMTEFAEALFRFNRQPLNLVIDEADEFAPQNPMPESKRMLHHIDRIVRRGRVRGFRVMLITQRPAVLHKNVLTQANALIALRLPAPQDRKAIMEWIKGQADVEQGNQVLASLAGLARGHGWLWAPELGVLERMHFPAIRTFDSSRTPEDGETIEEPQRLADVDLGEITATLDAAVEDAAANDPKRLRARIAELERELAKPRDLAVDTAALARAEAQGYSRGKIDGYGAAIDALRPIGERLKTLRDGLVDQIDVVLDGLGQWGDRQVRTAERVADEQPQAADSAPKRESEFSPPAKRPAQFADMRKSASSTLPKAERLVLAALAQYPRGRSKTQIAILTAYSVSGGGFNNALGALRSAGRIEGSGDCIAITQKGLEDLGEYEPLPRGRDLLRHWLNRLGKAERAVLETLAGAYPRALPKDELARRAGYEPNGGGFNNALSRLRTLELIAGRGELRASAELFE